MLCAFRGTLGFSTVLGQFKGVQKYVLEVKIRNLGVCALRACTTCVQSRLRLREHREIVSRLLKVVETQICAQNDCNIIQVYIFSIYNKPTLSALSCTALTCTFDPQNKK